ncbi:MAG: MFS transporter [Burkholderiaceae bacterium]
MTQTPGKPSVLKSLGFQMSLLTAMQALLLVNNVTLNAVSGLAGFFLAEQKWLATLPVTGYVLGGAVWAMPAAAFMRRFGRRHGYTVASLGAMVGGFLGLMAMNMGSMTLLCLATFVAGIYRAFGASLRFAAVDVAEAYRPSFKSRAISLVLTGGIVGGVVGPEMAVWSRSWLPAEFAGTYLSLIGFALISMVLAQFIRLPASIGKATSGPARPLRVILKQPVCWVAILCAALGYGIMNLLMVATPLAMEAHHHAFSSTAWVLEWHIIGMFAPGLITGSLIARFGVLPIVFTGTLLMLTCVAVSLNGVDVMHFTVALIALGVGWNFMYTGGSTMLTQSYAPGEKNRVQGFMDVCVFTTMMTTSASSGALIYANGWNILNLISLPFIVLTTLAVLWLAMKRGWQFGSASEPIGQQVGEPKGKPTV